MESGMDWEIINFSLPLKTYSGLTMPTSPLPGEKRGLWGRIPHSAFPLSTQGPHDSQSVAYKRDSARSRDMTCSTSYLMFRGRILAKSTAFAHNLSTMTEIHSDFCEDGDKRAVVFPQTCFLYYLSTCNTYLENSMVLYPSLSRKERD